MQIEITYDQLGELVDAIREYQKTESIIYQALNCYEPNTVKLADTDNLSFTIWNDPHAGCSNFTNEVLEHHIEKYKRLLK